MLQKLLEILGLVEPKRGSCKECGVTTSNYVQIGMGSELGFWKCFVCKTCREKKHAVQG